MSVFSNVGPNLLLPQGVAPGQVRPAAGDSPEVGEPAGLDVVCLQVHSSIFIYIHDMSGRQVELLVFTNTVTLHVLFQLRQRPRNCLQLERYDFCHNSSDLVTIG